MAPKATRKRAKKKPLTEKKKAQMQIVEKKPKASKNLVEKARSDESTNKSLYLAEEIIFDILKWLPSISLLRFKESLFMPIITSKPFVDSHFACSYSRPGILISCFPCWTNWYHEPKCDLYRVDLEQLRAVPFDFFNLKSIKDSRFTANEVSNCVNGVVLIKRNDNFRACNLSTREFIDVAYPQCDSCPYLLGFDPRSKSFKVLAYCNCLPLLKSQFYILTLGTNVWRKIKPSPFCYIGEIVCVNGTIYMASRWLPDINAFDLATEKFRPILVQPVASRCWRLFQFNESLGFADYQLENEKTINIRVWKLTENFLWVKKTKNSLSLSFPFRLKVTHIPNTVYLWVSPCIGGLWVSPQNDDELLVFVRSTTQYMIRWNLNNNTTQYVKISGLPRSHFRSRVDHYVQNLISLKDL